MAGGEWAIVGYVTVSHCSPSPPEIVNSRRYHEFRGDDTDQRGNQFARDDPLSRPIFPIV